MGRDSRRVGASALLWAVCCLWPAASPAQDLTPRAYWPAPKGIKVAVVGYSYATGDVLFDPSTPLYGVDSSINAGIVAYLQTFSLWGRTTNVLVELPYSWGTTKGLLFADPARRDFSGLGDLGLTLAVNLLGAPSMTPAQFQELRANPHPILGASLKVVAPTGSYDSDRLINVGANRWGVKAELGYMIPLRPKWLLELEAGVWFFGDDDDFLPGKREQEPIFAGDVHLVKRFKPGFWASLDLNYFTGGRQTIGGVRLGDVQRNSRLGGTVVVPFRGRHAIKVGYSRGVVTEFGTDFRQFIVSYQTVFR
ncbi:MAG: transporter [Thermoanaerobaculia bacterium]